MQLAFFFTVGAAIHPPRPAPAPNAGSSQANPFACVASGIAALWGPAHGGANEAVLKVRGLAAGLVVQVWCVGTGPTGGRRLFCQLPLCSRRPHLSAAAMPSAAPPYPSSRPAYVLRRLPSAAAPRILTARPPCPLPLPPAPPTQQMLEEIDRLGGVEQIPTMVLRAKDKNDPFRLMGFGHRVYKSYDPRAKLMRQVGENGRAEGRREGGG